MDGIIDKDKLTIVKENEYTNPDIEKINSLIDISIKDCYNKFFHTFDHECEYDLNFTNVNNNETLNLTISEKNLMTFELNKKLIKARKQGLHLII